MGAAREMLARMPAHRISLRELARSAGISHAAPYRHFPERADFLAALAAKCMTEFVAAQRTVAQADAEPVERLLDVGAAYVAYGADNPNAFHLMFDVDVSPPENPPDELAPLVVEHRDLLLETVESALTSGQLDLSANLQHVANALWSQVHGLTHLVVMGHIRRDEVPEVLAALLRG